MVQHVPSALAVEDLVIPAGATESATWPTPWLYAEGEPYGPPEGWGDEPGAGGTDGWRARLTVRPAYGSATVLAVFHSEDLDADGVLTLGTATLDAQEYASITPSVQPAVSSAWTWDAGVWDLELATRDGARVLRLVEGSVVLSREATSDV